MMGHDERGFFRHKDAKAQRGAKGFFSCFFVSLWFKTLFSFILPMLPAKPICSCFPATLLAFLGDGLTLRGLGRFAIAGKIITIFTRLSTHVLCLFQGYFFN